MYYYVFRSIMPCRDTILFVLHDRSLVTWKASVGMYIVPCTWLSPLFFFVYFSRCHPYFIPQFYAFYICIIDFSFSIDMPSYWSPGLQPNQSWVQLGLHVLNIYWCFTCPYSDSDDKVNVDGYPYCQSHYLLLPGPVQFWKFMNSHWAVSCRYM